MNVYTGEGSLINRALSDVSMGCFLYARDGLFLILDIPPQRDTQVEQALSINFPISLKCLNWCSSLQEYEHEVIKRIRLHFSFLPLILRRLPLSVQ